MDAPAINAGGNADLKHKESVYPTGDCERIAFGTACMIAEAARWYIKHASGDDMTALAQRLEQAPSPADHRQNNR